MGRLIEGVWDCVYCDSKKIRGSIRVCPVCGRQRDDNVKFYMDDPHNYVDEQKAKTINRNPDWLCSYCDGFNSDDVNICPTCGAGREDSEKNYFEHRQEIDARRAQKQQTNQHDRSNTTSNNRFIKKRITKDVEDYDHIANEPTSEIKTPKKKKKKITRDRSEDVEKVSLSRRISRVDFNKLITISVSVITAIVLVCLLVSFFSPKVETATIDDFYWERNIAIEKEETVEKNDWFLPSSARLLYTREEIRTYEQVLDHYETQTETYYEQELVGYDEEISYKDLGNGYFEEVITQVPIYENVQKTREVQVPIYRDEPVYDTKYYYEIEVWNHDYYLKTSGHDKNPYWENVILQEKQREGKRIETYTIKATTEDGKQKTYNLSFDEWNSLELGQTIKLKVKFFGNDEIIYD